MTFFVRKKQTVCLFFALIRKNFEQKLAIKQKFVQNLNKFTLIYQKILPKSAFFDKSAPSSKKVGILPATMGV